LENPGIISGEFILHEISSADPNTGSLITTDLDGDNDIDLLFSVFDHPSQTAVFDAIKWLENDGDGIPRFNLHSIGNPRRARLFMTISDLDRDGNTDIFVNRDPIWYENDGAILPAFTERPVSQNEEISAFRVVSGDLNGDQFIDTIYTALDTIGWYKNHGDTPPTFTNNVIDDNFIGPLGLTVTDLDSDNDLDIIAGSDSLNNLVWYKNNGDSITPLFVSIIIDSDLSFPKSIVAADLDKYHDVDLVLINSPTVIWYENNGASLPDFTKHTLNESGNFNQTIIAVDMDGYDDLDLITLIRIISDRTGGLNLIPLWFRLVRVGSPKNRFTSRSDQLNHPNWQILDHTREGSLPND
jgi:hypothetical protein